jgi:hypothetical protein
LKKKRSATVLGPFANEIRVPHLRFCGAAIKMGGAGSNE